MISDTKLTRRKMVVGQIFTNRVMDEKILAALETIPRENFVPENYKRVAYIDEQIPIAHGRYMLEPLAAARLLQAAQIKEHDNVLDLACGTGYSSALASLLAQKVTAVETDEELARKAKIYLQNIKINNVEVLKSIPSGLFDVIIINGAVEVVPPKLILALNEGGRLVAISEGFVEVTVKQGKNLSSTKTDQAFAAILPEFRKAQSFIF